MKVRIEFFIDDNPEAARSVVLPIPNPPTAADFQYPGGGHWRWVGPLPRLRVDLDGGHSIICEVRRTDSVPARMVERAPEKRPGKLKAKGGEFRCEKDGRTFKNESALAIHSGRAHGKKSRSGRGSETGARVKVPEPRETVAPHATGRKSRAETDPVAPEPLDPAVTRRALQKLNAGEPVANVAHDLGLDEKVVEALRVKYQPKGQAKPGTKKATVEPGRTPAPAKADVESVRRAVVMHLQGRAPVQVSAQLGVPTLQVTVWLDRFYKRTNMVRPAAGPGLEANTLWMKMTEAERDALAAAIAGEGQ
jgi:hypothetical protein